MNTFTRAWTCGLGGCLAVLLAACGSHTDQSLSGGGGNPTPSANALQVIIDAGPSGLVSQNIIAANTLYASVTICTPGSTTACQTIDHLQVDTGSVGLRLIHEALSGVAVPTPLADPATGNPLMECVQFADGYSWGSVATADVTIGGRALSSMAVQVIGDPAAGTAPTSCVSGPPEATVAQFGANGVLGIGNFLQDCGAACAGTIEPATYYICPAGACTGTVLPVADQLQNPVSLFSTDNNGVMISLPAVASPGAASVTGTLYFGVGTQTDNALGAANWYTLDAVGTFVTNFEGINQSNSFLDTGSNAYFFPTSTILVCADYTQFYCPTSNNMPVSVPETATIQGSNGAQAQISFTVDNTDTLFAIANDTAYPNLAGPYGAVNGTTAGFDWGLPFFLGGNVFVLFENQTVGGTTGPAVAF